MEELAPAHATVASAAVANHGAAEDAIRNAAVSVPSHAAARQTPVSPF